MLKYHRPTPGSCGLNLNASSTCARRRQYRVDFWSRALSAATPYRALLDAKIALVGAMIALALFNRFRLAPRLASAAAALAALRATCAIEVALGPSWSPWSACLRCRIRPLVSTSWWWTQSRQTRLGRSNSLLTGKRTANFSFLGHFRENCQQKRTHFQTVTSEFPKNQNREIIQQSRERYPREQGITIANTSLRRARGDLPFRIASVYLMYSRERDPVALSGASEIICPKSLKGEPEKTRRGSLRASGADGSD
jgi:hypothetical protein